jgi:hypothetical protein
LKFSEIKAAAIMIGLIKNKIRRKINVSSGCMVVSPWDFLPQIPVIDPPGHPGDFPNVGMIIQ